MVKKTRIRVAVIYGGVSGEHEISLISAASVIRNLDRTRFEVVPISIDKKGHWFFNDITLIENFLKQGLQALPIYATQTKELSEVLLPFSSIEKSQGSLIPVSQAGSSKTTTGIDVFFPVMHGPLCEDGAIQGVLEMAGVPYVGSGVLGSAIGMDKEVAKRLAKAAGVPVVPYLLVRSPEVTDKLLSAIDRELSFPVFVKPANMGSSVGVSKVSEKRNLEEALRKAFLYDVKVLVEKAIRAREIEVSVLESSKSDSLIVSVPGEIIPHHEFYSYEAKYLDENGASFRIPAELTESQTREVQRLATVSFGALECQGMARVDFFFDLDRHCFFFNELNTIPGFTSISMYPKLLEASGIPYSDLLTVLIELAMERHLRKKSLLTERLPKN